MSNIALDGFIQGMEKQGCKFIKQEQEKVFFEIPERLAGEPMQKAKKLFNSVGLRLFTKVSKELT